MSLLPENIGELVVLHYPDPRLREVARRVPDPTDPKLAELVDRMRVLMKDGRGVGLAATQVGAAVRLFLANPTGEPDDELVVVNGEIIQTEGWTQTEEGCLSVPGASCKLRRHAKIVLRYLDLAAQTHRIEADGLLSTIIQHETDHLDGRLIVDRVGTLGRLAIRGALEQLESEYESAQAAAGR